MGGGCPKLGGGTLKPGGGTFVFGKPSLTGGGAPIPGGGSNGLNLKYFTLIALGVVRLGNNTTCKSHLVLV